VGKAIAKARAEKTPPWKQSDLAQKVNEKPSVINGKTPFPHYSPQTAAAVLLVDFWDRD